MKIKNYIVDREILQLQENLLQNPENHSLLSKLAFALNIRSMHNEALPFAQKSIKMQDNNPEAWYELIIATAFAQEDELEKLINRCQSMEKKFPKASWPYRNSALLFYYLEQFDKIEALCRKALTINPSDESAYRILGYFYYAQRNYSEAQNYLKKSIKAKSDDCRSLWMLGHCYLENNNLVKAHQYYDKAIEQEEFFIFGWNSLGRQYLYQEQGFRKALQCFSKSLSINPHFWQTYFILADYYLVNKSYYEAISQYLHMLILEPEAAVKAECHTSLGLLFTLIAEPGKGYYHLHQAIKADENWLMAYYHLGSLYLSEKKYQKAMKFFRQAITIDPNFAWAYTKMGGAYREQNMLSEAETYFNKALQLDKEEYWAHIGLADIYRKQKKTKQLLKESLKALSIAPDDSDVRNYMGIAYECNKQFDEAITQYSKALELDPYNRGAANNLGFLYEKLLQKKPSKHLKQKAIEAWKKRLLICRDTSHSITGAVNHLKKLEVRESTIEKWLETGKLTSSK